MTVRGDDSFIYLKRYGRGATETGYVVNIHVLPNGRLRHGIESIFMEIPKYLGFFLNWEFLESWFPSFHQIQIFFLKRSIRLHHYRPSLSIMSSKFSAIGWEILCSDVQHCIHFHFWFSTGQN